MKLIGNCHLCGMPAMQTCASCGMVTCVSCINEETGVCFGCQAPIIATEEDFDEEDDY